MKAYNITYFLFLSLSLALVNHNYANSENLEQVANLSGKWKFSIGDNSEWAASNFNDNNWESIDVPGSWESQGFHGYDGYAWYRTNFEVDVKYASSSLYLSLGYIDDVDEVYLNGELIGKTGSFPNNYSTAYNAKRIYKIPNDIFNCNGKNTIAIRIFDMGGEGGIIHGSIALLYDIEAIPVEYDLQGTWKFIIGNCELSDSSSTNFSNWSDIIVPGIWEDQGYKNYDGLACYATEFQLTNKFQNQRMVLVLGKIDDLEQVYLNGKLVGTSGPLKKSTLYFHDEFHKQLRGYYLPLDILNHNGKNTLIVKVFDAGGIGGLYQGSFGLITQEKYIEYWHNSRKQSY